MDLDFNSLASWFGCATGLLGSALLALNTRVSGWGFVAYLASNAAWIAFAVASGNTALLVQQLGFTTTSLVGCWRWLGHSRPRRLVATA